MSRWGAELAIFEKSSHMAVIEEPDADLASLNAFLERAEYSSSRASISANSG